MLVDLVFCFSFKALLKFFVNKKKINKIMLHFPLTLTYFNYIILSRRILSIFVFSALLERRNKL